MLCVYKHVGVDNELCEQLRGGLDMMQYVEEVLCSPLSVDGPQAAVVGWGNESHSIPFTGIQPVVEEVPGVVPIVHSQSCVIAGSLCWHEGSPQVLFPESRLSMSHLADPKKLTKIDDLC